MRQQRARHEGYPQRAHARRAVREGECHQRLQARTVRERGLVHAGRRRADAERTVRLVRSALAIVRIAGIARAASAAGSLSSVRPRPEGAAAEPRAA
jgi:hypothetical protein